MQTIGQNGNRQPRVGIDMEVGTGKSRMAKTISWIIPTKLEAQSTIRTTIGSRGSPECWIQISNTFGK